MSKKWANKMRAIYITSFVLIVGALAAPSVYTALNPPLTCFDGIMNQGETAIDLGGPCHYLNPQELRPLNLQWARSFPVVPGLYSSVAYVENPNKGGGIRKLDYIFKLFDSRNVLVAERLGTTFIPAGKVVPIFEGNMKTGTRVPRHTTLQFINNITWERVPSERAAEVFVTNKSLSEKAGAPRISATIENRGVYALRNLVVVATLFDEVGNAVGSSRTIVESLPASSDHTVIFTWPKKFTVFIAKFDVVPLLPAVDSL